MPVIITRLFAIGTGWNDSFHSGCGCGLNNRIRIVTFVSNKRSGFDVAYQLASLCAIRHGTCCNKNSDRHTIRIHGQMYLGISPPFVRPIASLPPFAPDACWWIFT